MGLGKRRKRGRDKRRKGEGTKEYGGSLPPLRPGYMPQRGHHPLILRIDAAVNNVTSFAFIACDLSDCSARRRTRDFRIGRLYQGGSLDPPKKQKNLRTYAHRHSDLVGQWH